jgi:hypothetical protein
MGNESTKEDSKMNDANKTVEEKSSKTYPAAAVFMRGMKVW